MSPQKILVDTDVLIDFLRHKSGAKEILEEASASHDLYLSVMTVAELMAGMRPAETEATEALISGFTLLPVTETIARQGGTLRRKIGSKKALLADCLIAATAIGEDCLLLTHNQKGYASSGVRFFLSNS